MASKSNLEQVNNHSVSKRLLASDLIMLRAAGEKYCSNAYETVTDNTIRIYVLRLVILDVN